MQHNQSTTLAVNVLSTETVFAAVVVIWHLAILWHMLLLEKADSQSESLAWSFAIDIKREIDVEVWPFREINACFSVASFCRNINKQIAAIK